MTPNRIESALAFLGDPDAAELRMHISELASDAENWRKLMRIAGHWQDGSDTVITLSQDECTRDVLIKVQQFFRNEPNRYFASTFEAALALISE